MTRGETSSEASTAIPISTTAYEMHDLNDVAIAESQRSVRVTVAQYCAIVFDYNEAGIDPERAKQARDGAVPLELTGRPVHHQRDHLARFRRLNHRLKYSA